MLSPTAATIAQNRRLRARKRTAIIALLLVILAAFFTLTLMLGQSFTPPSDVMRVLLGEHVQGASFTAPCWQFWPD